MPVTGVEELLGHLPRAEGREALVAVLKKLGEFPGAQVAQAVVPYIDHDDYLVRSRAFVTLCRVAHPVIIPRLFDFLEREKDVEFRLRCLEVFHCLGEPATVAPLAALLVDRDPLFLRGLVWTLGSIGGVEAVRVLLAFGSTPAGRIVKPDLVAEAVGMALENVENPQEVLEAATRESPRVARYLRDLTLRTRDEARYSVYPTSDYFRLQAQERGLDYREYKRLLNL